MQARQARTTQPTNASGRYTIGAALTYVRATLTASLDGIDEPLLTIRSTIKNITLPQLTDNIYRLLCGRRPSLIFHITDRAADRLGTWGRHTRGQLRCSKMMMALCLRVLLGILVIFPKANQC